MKLPELLSEEREPYLLGLLRVAISALVLWLTIKLARSYLVNGYFGDVFHLPLLPETLVPNRAGYGLLLTVQGLAALLALLGVAARPALLLTALCGLYGMACDRLQYHNNRYTLLLVTLLLAFAPCDRAFTPLRTSDRAPAPRWAAYLIGAQLSLVYLSSCLGKLLDHDWRTGGVMRLRFAPLRDRAALWLPDALADWLTQPWFGQAAALAALATELLLALGPWLPRTRAVALWVGVLFHIGIELFARVEFFSYTMLCSYLVFATPELRERRLVWRDDTGAPSLLARFMGRLDLMARFRHERATGQAELLVVYDRAGIAHRGLAALRELSRATPLLFPLWLPLRLLETRLRTHRPTPPLAGA